jgi:hypothetical protein
MINRRAPGALSATLLLATLSCAPNSEYQDPVEDTAQDLSGTFPLRAVSSDKCVEAPDSGKPKDTVLAQASCHKASDQQWQIHAISGSTTIYTIVSASSGLCADVFGASKDDGGKIVQWTCNGKANQRWRLLDKGTVHRLQSVNSGKCATIAGNSNDDGAGLQQQPCSTSAKNQKFDLGSGGGTTDPGTGGSGGGNNGNDGLVWQKANLTNFESYPNPGSPECIEFNGCMWAGQFAFINGKQSESWVQAHNIAAVHEKDGNKYKLKTLRLRQGTKTIDVKVYDECADSDCDGCCTHNAQEHGLNFLIDIEKFTMQRFHTGEGIVEWACTDCK